VYLIEISRNALKVFILLFPNFEVPEIYLCEVMAEKKAQKLMTESSNMFEELIKKFHIKYGKLQISGYHGLAADPRRAGTVSPSRSRFGVAKSNAKANEAVKKFASNYGYGAAYATEAPPQATGEPAEGSPPYEYNEQLTVVQPPVENKQREIEASFELTNVQDTKKMSPAAGEDPGTIPPAREAVMTVQEQEDNQDEQTEPELHPD
jgi:hypothetical protein